MLLAESKNSKYNAQTFKVGRRGEMVSDPAEYQITQTSNYSIDNGEVIIQVDSFSASKKPSRIIRSKLETELSKVTDPYKHIIDDIFWSVYGDTTIGGDERSFMRKVVEYIEKYYSNQKATKYTVSLYVVGIFPRLFE